MSSIDKGIENIVNRMGRNVRVSHSGDYIVGTINGEVIFRVHDRYGYVNANEEQIVRDGIRRYDEEQRRRAQRAAEERRRREEAIRLARLQAEKEERERLERLRIQAKEQSIEVLKSKKLELKNMVSRHQTNSDTIQKELTSISKGVNNFKQYSWLNSVDIQNEMSNFISYVNNAVNQTANHYKQMNSNISQYEAQITNNLTEEQYNNLTKTFRKIKIAEETTSVSTYECQQMVVKVNNINQACKTINQTIIGLDKLKDVSGVVGNLATETLRSISATKVRNTYDLENILRKVENALLEIENYGQSSQLKKEINEILSLEAEINSCKEARTLVAEGTYIAKDYRNEIVEKAQEVKNEFTNLSTSEFTTCEKQRITIVKNRLEDILLGNEASEEVKEEVLRLHAEYENYVELDRIHKPDFDEYNKLIKELSTYDVEDSDIPPFVVKEYPKIRDGLKDRLRVLQAEKRKSDLYINNINTTNVMLDMGYELFSRIGDPLGNVTECLFTKRGYNGVLWQVICSAEGTVTRRIIGVNKGETQTDIDYVKEVAEQMEADKDPEEFLEKFKEISGSTFRVNSAVESYSENAEEVIKKNGYYYLNEQALKHYEDRVTEIVNNKPVKKKERQVKVQANNIVKNSNQTLVQAANRSRLMAREN